MESSIAVFLMRQLACEQLPARCVAVLLAAGPQLHVSRCALHVHAYGGLPVSLVGQAGWADCIAQGVGCGPTAGHTFSAFWL